MENKQQTAVEWLFSQLPDHLRLSRDGFDMFQIAKGMEREQIEEAWNKRGKTIVPKYFLEENINGEQYYNQTYAD